MQSANWDFGSALVVVSCKAYGDDRGYCRDSGISCRDNKLAAAMRSLLGIRPNHLKMGRRNGVVGAKGGSRADGLRPVGDGRQLDRVLTARVGPRATCMVSLNGLATTADGSTAPGANQIFLMMSFSTAIGL